MARAPVFAGDFPDPFVLALDTSRRHTTVRPGGGSYIAYGTNSGPWNVQLLVSGDLVGWTHAGDALPAVAGWARPGWTWAPSVLVRPGSYVLYYTVREPRSGRQAISRASAGEATGPFVDDSSSPLVFQAALGGSIDASPFVDIDGTAYLLWKADANALDRPSSLWAQRLTADGLGLRGRPVRLLSVGAPWERPLVEAPSMVQAGSRYFLFYSGGWWESTTYGIGYAVGPGPLGPFTKVTTSAPWVGSDSTVAGPGGQEFFPGPGGLLYMAYHGWEPGRVGYPGGARTLRLAPVSFDGEAPALVD